MVSEHQRDLVGSSVARDFPTIVVNLVNQLDTLLREASGKPFISRIAVDEASLKRNFEAQGDAILAEPIYIALQMAGYEGDAHELVNYIAMPHSRQGGSLRFLKRRNGRFSSSRQTRCGVKSRRRRSTC